MNRPERCRYLGGFPLNRDPNKNEPHIASASWASNPRSFSSGATLVFAFTGNGGTYLYARILEPREPAAIKRNLSLKWHQLLHIPDPGTFCLFNPNIPLQSPIACHLVIVTAGKVMMLRRVRVGHQPLPTCIYDAVDDTHNHEPGRPVAVKNAAFTSDGLILLIFTSFTQTVRSMNWCQQEQSASYSWKITNVRFEPYQQHFYSLIGCTPKDNEKIFAAASSSRIRIFQRTDNGVDIDWNPVGYGGYQDVNATTAMCFNSSGAVLASLDAAGVVHLFSTRNPNGAPRILPLRTVVPPPDAPISKISWVNDFKLLYCMGTTLRDFFSLDFGSYELPPHRRAVELGEKFGVPPHDMVLQFLTAPGEADKMTIAVLGHNMFMHFYTAASSRFSKAERNILHEKFLTRPPISDENILVRYKAKRQASDGKLARLLVAAAEQVNSEETRLHRLCTALDSAIESKHAGEISAEGFVQRVENIRQTFGSGSGGPPEYLVPLFQPLVE